MFPSEDTVIAGSRVWLVSKLPTLNVQDAREASCGINHQGRKYERDLHVHQAPFQIYQYTFQFFKGYVQWFLCSE